MGRPKAKNGQYFRHYAQQSKTKRILFKELGHAGIACWFELLEMLTHADYHYLDLSDDLEYLDFTATLHLSDEQAEKFLTLLTRIGKVDAELWEKRKIIWCQNLIDRGGIACGE